MVSGVQNGQESAAEGRVAEAGAVMHLDGRLEKGQAMSRGRDKRRQANVGGRVRGRTIGGSCTEPELRHGRNWLRDADINCANGCGIMRQEVLVVMGQEALEQEE